MRDYIERHITDIMLWVILICLGGSLIMIAANSAATSRIAKDTAKTTDNTNDVVRKQAEILNAVQKVTLETQLTAETQTKIIICMLKVPIDQRTDDLEKNCRRVAGAPLSSPDPTVSKTPDKNQSPQQTPTKSTSANPGANSGGGSGLGNQQPSILPLSGLRVCTPGSIVLNGVCISN